MEGTSTAKGRRGMAVVKIGVKEKSSRPKVVIDIHLNEMCDLYA